MDLHLFTHRIEVLVGERPAPWRENVKHPTQLWAYGRLLHDPAPVPGFGRRIGEKPGATSVQRESLRWVLSIPFWGSFQSPPETTALGRP